MIAPIYKTPFFNKDKGSYLAQLLGGYEVTGIYTVRTVRPSPCTTPPTTTRATGIPRYNPVTPVTQHTFKSIPKGKRRWQQ